MITIFLGDVDEALSVQAKQQYPQARLLDYHNYKEFLTTGHDADAVYYTSLGDLPKNFEIVFEILMCANRVIYCAPDRWSDQQKLDCIYPGASMQGQTEIILAMLPDSIIVENFCPTMTDPMPLVGHRQTDARQMWSVGCSITHGTGIARNQCYGNLLAQGLGLPCSFLTRPGGSISWAADQVLRSDVRSEDLVVWGLTNPERLTYIHQHQLLHGVTALSYEYFPEYKKIVDPQNLSLHDNLYKQYYAVQQVINFCQKIGANLIFINLLYGNHFIQRALRTYKNYVHVPYHVTVCNNEFNVVFIDFGSDNLHPGPQQHQQYFQLLLNYICNQKDLRQIYQSNL